MSTGENLKAAFAGESQANRKYLAFAKKAEQDGLKQTARLFRATAEAETIHAHAHLRLMSGIQSTVENLQVAAAGEAYEYQSMYPGFLKEAEAEGNKPAAMIFKYALEAERVHNRLYTQAIDVVKTGKDLPAGKVYLCPICGNIEIGTPSDKCVICGAPKDKFVEIQ